MFGILILILLYISICPILDVKSNQYLEQVEKENIEYRRSIDPIIRAKLKSLIYESDAYKASIFEFHNGTSNMSVLGFLYAAMTYEETKEGVNKVSQLYNEVSLPLFNISNIIFKNGYWCGSIKDLQEIDPALSHGISSSSKTKYICVVLLEDSRELGFLVLSFDYLLNVEKQQAVDRFIKKSKVCISSLLDYQYELRFNGNSELGRSKFN